MQRMPLRGVVLAAIVLIAAGGCAAPDPRREALGPIPPLLGTLTAADALGAMDGGWGDAWVDDIWDGRLLRMSGADGRVVARIPVYGRLGLSGGAGAMWALQAGDGYGRDRHGPLLKIDPRTNRVAARTALRTLAGQRVVAFGVLAGAGGAWVWGPMDVLRVDPRTGRMAQAFAMPYQHGELSGAALTARGLLATAADGSLLRIDPRTGVRLVRAAPGGAGTAIRSAGAGRLVFTAQGDVWSTAQADGRVAWHRRLGFRIGAVLPAGRVLMVSGAVLEDAGDRLWAIDARTGRVLRSIVLPTFDAADMAIVDGALWVSCVNGKVLVIPRWLTRHLASD
jgi:outer membrane protein assembly factor BamB